MTIDTTPLGRLTADLMEKIATEYAHSDEFTIRTAAIIVEVDSKRTGQLLAECTDDRPWVLQALLNEALDTIERKRALMWRAANEDDE